MLLFVLFEAKSPSGFSYIIVRYALLLLSWVRFSLVTYCSLVVFYRWFQSPRLRRNVVSSYARVLRGSMRLFPRMSSKIPLPVWGRDKILAETVSGTVRILATIFQHCRSKIVPWSIWKSVRGMTKIFDDLEFGVLEHCFFWGFLFRGTNREKRRGHKKIIKYSVTWKHISRNCKPVFDNLVAFRFFR